VLLLIDHVEAPLRDHAVIVTGTVDGPVVVGEQAYAPDPVVAALSGGPVGYARVDLSAADGVAIAPLVSRLFDLLNAVPDASISVVDGSAVRTREARDAVRQFDNIFAVVGMFVAIAVAAAALVATSTFRIVFAQRLRQLALLRTIGANPGQLAWALAAEGTVVGLVAGVIGVLSALGIGLAAPAAGPAAAGPAGAGLPGPARPDPSRDPRRQCPDPHRAVRPSTPAGRGGPVPAPLVGDHSR